MFSLHHISELVRGRSPKNFEILISNLNDEDLANYTLHLMRKHERATRVLAEIIKPWKGDKP